MKKFLLVAVLSILHSPLQAELNQQKTFDYDSWLHTLGEVINIFESRYYGKIKPEEAMSEAIRGFALQDPHTMFLDAKSCKDLQEKMSGEFFGIGIVLPGDKHKDEEFFPVIETIPGGPSDKAGIKTGDKVIQIDDDLVKGLDIDEIMTRLKGEKNTSVTLTILREKYPESLKIEVTRDIVKDEMALAYYFPEHQVHYLLLAIFSEKSAGNVEKIISTAIKNKSKGLILDLRNNTGGLFDSAIDIAGLFLPKGTPVVSIKERNGKVAGEWKTTHAPLSIPHTMPIFILVNNYTASASEILAGTLQVYATKKNMLQVFIVGDETFGKGSVQEVIPVSNESALKLTTGLYFLPFNTSIQGKGVTPDFKFEYRSPPTETMKWMTTNYGKESSLKGSIKPNDHVEVKKENKKEDVEKTWKEKRQEILSQDYFIQNTINLIGLYHTGIKAFPKQFSTHKKTLQFLKENYAIDTKLETQEVKL